MATLVLTVAGGLIGGPVGAALGGLAGQAIDRNVLFRPKGREGPRLADLSVQTSSYGVPIPRVFGTMRVAGSIIWSTDLIETRSSSSAGKGQPSVASYSYSVSFAVLLSSRPITGVGRIWADGNLLRGAAGDFKTQTGFRLHLGDEDQAADPLIASAEGLAMAPAHRGGAYAVFEDFQLADYGNRIPSLTFELVADPAAVPIGAIAADIAGSSLDGTGVSATLGGFSAYGDSAREVLDGLADAAGGWFAPGGDGVTMRVDTMPVRTLADAGFARADGRGNGSVRARSIAALETVPQTLAVAHYDPARDYQTGVQRARRPGAGSRAARIDLPAVVEAAVAKGMAEAALARAEAARERRVIAAAWSDIDLPPGSPVAIEGEAGRWRIESWSLEGMVLTLELVRLAEESGGPGTASPGRVLPAPDIAIGTTLLHAFELPALDDALLQAPRLLVAAAGSAPGWRQAALLLSTDNGARYSGLGATAAPAVIGVVKVPPGVASAMLVDRRGSIEVELAHPAMAVMPADDRALDSGANLALLGDELIQFGAVSQITPTRWRLSELWRGRRGTEAAIGTQRAGDRFVLLDADSLVSADLPIAALGGGAIVLASGVGDIAGPARADTAMTGASVRPPSPAQLAARRSADGAVSLVWARRSRLGWRWIDGIDAPLGEERELYRISIAPPAGPTTQVETDRPGLVLAALPQGTVIAVRQVGNAGESPSATLILES